MRRLRLILFINCLSILTSSVWANCDLNLDFILPANQGIFPKKYFKKNWVNRNLEIKNLCETSSWNGKYFRIHKVTNEDEIKIDDSKDSLKASFVYYHLTKALEYFFQLNPELKNNSHIKFPISIRLDIVNLFDPAGKYAHEKFATVFNDAVSIPGSTDLRRTTEEWEREIWFRPYQKTFMRAPYIALGESLQKKSFLESTFKTSLSNQIVSYFSNFTEFELNYFFSQLAYTAATPLVFYGIGIVVKKFKTKFYLESALIPGIIYHEFTHIMLNDYIELSNSPVIEGYANFFAGSILKEPKWGHWPKRYSKDAGKNSKKKMLYNLNEEQNAQSSFVYTLLSKVSQGIKKYGISGEEFVYASRKKYEKFNFNKNILFDQKNRKNFNIKDDLTRALISTVDDLNINSEKKLQLKLHLINTFITMGI